MKHSSDLVCKTINFSKLHAVLIYSENLHAVSIYSDL